MMALLFVLGVILYLDRVCISVALPKIQVDLDLPPERLGWISAAFSIAYGLFEVPTGHLGDRRGPGSVLTRIVVWWSAFTALTGAALGFPSLLVTRFLFGAGEAGAWPNVGSVVGRWFPATQRARALSIFGASTSLGGSLSPLLVVPMQAAFGWRSSFFVFALAGAAWAVVWRWWYREPQAVVPEGAPVKPLQWSRVLRARAVWGLMALASTWIYAAFFGVFWLPTFLVKGRSFSDGDLRWSALLWVGGFFGNLLGGQLSDLAARRLGNAAGRRLVGVSATLVFSAMLAGIGVSHSMPVIIAALTVIGMMNGIIQVNLFAACIDVGGGHPGTVSGAMNTAGQLGGALSAVTFGYLVTLSGGYDVPVQAMAAVAAVGTLAWAMVDCSTVLSLTDD
jgi:MFS family permease